MNVVVHQEKDLSWINVSVLMLKAIACSYMSIAPKVALSSNAENSGMFSGVWFGHYKSSICFWVEREWSNMPLHCNRKSDSDVSDGERFGTKCTGLIHCVIGHIPFNLSNSFVTASSWGGISWLVLVAVHHICLPLLPGYVKWSESCSVMSNSLQPHAL